MKYLGLLLLLILPLRAQLLPGIDPKPPEPEQVDSLPSVEPTAPVLGGDDPILGGKIFHIHLRGVEKIGLVSGTPPLSRESGLLVPSESALAKLLRPMLGKPLRSSDLVEIVDTILLHYDRYGYPVVAVDVPMQSLSDGVLELTLEIGRIGQLGVASPSYGDPESIRDGLWLRSGDVVRRRDLDAQLAWYGRHAFRRPRLFVSPGDDPATADILIGLEESKPWRATVGYENSGPDLIGEDRFILGAAGMTPNEHLIAWQTVVGAPASSLTAHALSWELPLHASHQSIVLEAAYAEVLTRSLAGGVVVENQGTSWSAGLTHKLTLPAMGRWKHRLLSGFEVKSTDQFLLFGGGFFSPGEVRLLHARLRYELERDWDDGGLRLVAGLIGSPGGLIAGNEDKDFRAYDPEASSSYIVGRLSGQGWWSPGGDWRLGLRGAAQWADSRLLPAEQFAAGGYQTVRGVGEREFFTDNGWHASMEVVSPEWRPCRWLNLRGIAFLDAAWLKNRGQSGQMISGTGIGVRVKLAKHLDLRADHGWRVDGRGDRIHLGLTMRY